MKALPRRFLLLGLCLSHSFALGEETLATAVEKALLKTVPLVSTSELARELKSKKTFALLDTRERGEFMVSHLPAAQWIGYRDFTLESVSKLPKTTPIIVYCSIGYRSERIGERLQAAGFRNVRNLHGGLFAWANERRPLTDAQSQPTKTVHGYDKKWGRLLLPHVEVATPAKN